MGPPPSHRSRFPTGASQESQNHPNPLGQQQQSKAAEAKALQNAPASQNKMSCPMGSSREKTLVAGLGKRLASSR